MHDTTFLFKKPSFISGVASILDIYGKSNSRFNTSKTTEEADTKALISDWMMIGRISRRLWTDLKKNSKAQKHDKETEVVHNLKGTNVEERDTAEVFEQINKLPEGEGSCI